MDGVISTGSIFFDPFGVVADGLVVGGRSGETRLGADTTAAAKAAGEELAEMGHGVAGALVEKSGLGRIGFSMLYGLVRGQRLVVQIVKSDTSPPDVPD